MKDDTELIENRLNNIKNLYLKTNEIVDNLPEIIPHKVKEELKSIILNDKELKELMDGIENNRPPRIFLIGRTGVGKSSLINALCGAYVADVSDTMSCTSKTESYRCKKGEKTVMEILDTRGIAESLSIDEKQSAEKVLIDDMKKFSPDVAILILNSTHRDDVDKDVIMLKQLSDDYENINKTKLPIIVAINKCDEVSPTRFKNPEEYPEQKINNIEEIRKYYKEIIIKNGLKVNEIICISSLIDWKTKDDIEVVHADIKNMSENERYNLEIAFDGRYNMDILIDELEKSIEDSNARMGLRLAARIDAVVVNVANKLNKIFSGISAAVAATTLIPIQDMPILIALQMTLVTLIASLSGRKISMDTAKEFIGSVFGIAGGGFTLRTIARELVKVFPGIGTAVSSGIAYSGTYAMGKAAIAYYIEKKSIEDVRKIYKLNKKEK